MNVRILELILKERQVWTLSIFLQDEVLKCDIQKKIRLTCHSLLGHIRLSFDRNSLQSCIEASCPLDWKCDLPKCLFEWSDQLLPPFFEGPARLFRTRWSIKYFANIPVIPWSSCLTHLSLGERLVAIETLDHLPASLVSLSLKSPIHCSLDHLPAKLRHLTIAGQCDHALDHLPTTLQTLNLKGSGFSGHLDHLPPHLESLILPAFFRHAIDHLPVALKHLVVDYSYSHAALDHLPPGLVSLDLSGVMGFEGSLDHLPLTLRTLLLPCLCSIPLDHLPPELQCLECRDQIYNIPLDHLPVGLRRLVCPVLSTTRLDHLPRQLTHLSVKIADPHSRVPFCLDHLPSSLRHLDLSACTVLYTHLGQFSNLDHLPKKLVQLSLPDNLSVPFDHLPRGLQKLTIGVAFQSSLDFLPPHLRVLRVVCRDHNRKFSSFELSQHQSLDHLPPSLLVLDLRPCILTQITPHLPPQLVEFSYASCSHPRLAGLPFSDLQLLSFDLINSDSPLYLDFDVSAQEPGRNVLLRIRPPSKP